MKIEIEVSDERVDDLLTGHVWEDWLDVAENNDNGDWKTGTLKLRFDREEDNEGEMQGRKTVTRDDVRTGLATMAKKAAWAFTRWMEENDDRPACDAAWQCIIFGKLVYA